MTTARIGTEPCGRPERGIDRACLSRWRALNGGIADLVREEGRLAHPERVHAAEVPDQIATRLALRARRIEGRVDDAGT